MMDTNIFGKLEPFEIGCVVKSELDKLIQAKDECFNPLKSGRVVKYKDEIVELDDSTLGLNPLERVVLLNLTTIYRIMKNNKVLIPLNRVVLLN